MENNRYLIDEKEVDYYEFTETVNTNAKNYYYFLLNSNVASILLEEKTKKNCMLLTVNSLL